VEVYLPLPHGKKGPPLISGWTAVPPPTMHIGPDHNRGKRLDSPDVDVDADCREARIAASRFLPVTGRQHGRPSVGVTHWWFESEGARYEAFTDVVKEVNEDGKSGFKMLVEIRTGKDHYTVVPPSCVPVTKNSPTLETLRWFADGEPRTCEFDDLRTQVIYIAITALLARHFAPDGSRWEFFEALAGFLLGGLKLPANAACAIIDTAADIVGDCDTTPRPAEWIRRTEERLKNDQDCTGAPKVAKLIGEHGPAVVNAIRKWCGQASGGAGDAYPLTEAGDAECFADLYRDQVRYDHRRGRWLVSDETSGIWVPDPVERLTQMAISMARDRQRRANAIEDVTNRKAAWGWAIKGEGRGRINNTLTLARSVPPIADPGEHWDEEAFLLGVQNGVIDLRTGEWRKAIPADRVTMRVRVAYDPTATCPLWLQTLAGIFAPQDLFNAEHSQSMIDFMQRALGYSITGDCREECCFFTWGNGGNGKGTVMNTLGWLFGDYTDDMPYSTLERSERGSGIPNDVAKLVGKRFITCAEVNEFNLNEARLKALTGRDPMTARFLNQDFFTFIPVCKIWIATNNKPKIVGQDDGIWRRIHLIPFTQKFEGRENKQLKDQLREELPGILNWIIKGAALWLHEGLNPPDTVKAATAAYRQESNPIMPFIEACCVTDASLQAQASPTFLTYEQFCRDEGVEPWQRLSNKAFGKAMRQAFKVDDTGRQTFYLGIGLRKTPSASPAPPEQDAQQPAQDPEDPGPWSEERL